MMSSISHSLTALLRVGFQFAYLAIGSSWLMAQPVMTDLSNPSFASSAVPSSAVPSQTMADSPRRPIPSWPFTAQRGPFRFYSTIPIQHFETQIESLIALPKEIETALGIELAESPIDIVVLANEKEFDTYLHDRYPGLRHSSALFIQNRRSGLVLTWMHENWLVDSRHEVVHALLHAHRVALPLWLDEGLAEYFEHGLNRPEHPVHASPLRAQLKFGRIADLELQERWPSNMELSSEQYRDAWGTVAFLMHHSDATRQEFQLYLSDLFSDRATGFLSYRIRRTVPRWRDAYLKHYQSESKREPVPNSESIPTVLANPTIEPHSMRTR
jgi:hypothetical protein